MAGVWVLLGVLSVLWGGSFLFNEIALQGLPALAVAFGRVALAALALGLWLRLAGIAWPPRRAWPVLAMMGLLNNAVPFTLFTLAQGQIDASLAAILNATTPLWTVIVAHLSTAEEKLDRVKVLGLGLGFAGVVLLQGASGRGQAWAILACLAAALSYGLASVFGRRFKGLGVTPPQTAFGQLASSTLILALPFLLTRPWALPNPGPAPLLAVLALALLCSALAYLIFFAILARAGATVLSLVTFLIPVSAMGLGAVFLGERAAPAELAGLGLILAGLWVIGGRIRVSSAGNSRSA